MANDVKCKFCGIRFNKNAEDTVKIKNRYAHKKCYEEYEENKTKEDRDNEALEAYILKLFSINYLTPKIKNQINSFKLSYDYDAYGILRTLKYWFEIKKGDIEKAQNGIGIVPYVWEDAKNYYDIIESGIKVNENKSIVEVKTEEVKISYPKRKPLRRKLFSYIFEEEGDMPNEE